jgi:hypothetical protein
MFYPFLFTFGYMTIFDQMMIGSGVCWTITYLLIIRRGILDMSYGMPAAALFANLAWETIYSFILPHTQPQLIVDRIWFAFDVIILLQYLRFGPVLKRVQKRRTFYFEFILGFVLACLLIVFLSDALKDQYGAYAAFGQNLMMSVMFIVMLRDRKSVDGQSMYIAFFKCLGTLLASLAFYTQTKAYSHSPLMQLLFVAIGVYDVLYMILLYRDLRLRRLKPFRRL